MKNDDYAFVVERLSDPWWRLTSGKLYQIIIKGDNDDEGLVVPFVPNAAQRSLLQRLHHRNVILKARQLGFTTLVSILWLDTALFSKDPVRCGIIAQDREAAEMIFRDKVKFAYQRLPPFLRKMAPLAKDSASELLFEHNRSSIRVATSMRSGTIHRLHVSEFGKICAKYPDKAKEVVTGSIPAVPKSGILVIESTAEGQEGEFYKITQRAMAMQDMKGKLTPKDYRFHFFAWWEAPEYAIAPEGVRLTETHRTYFDGIEAKIGRELLPAQRAWYVATCEADFSGDVWKMRQEYPSCIAGDVLIGTPSGIMPIRNAVADGVVILNHMNKGVRPVFEVRTKLGYTVTCTNDHPIKTPSGEFRKIVDGLSVGDAISLSAPRLSTEQQFVSWSPVPFVDGRIHITPEFAEFLGVFMGDGSFYNGAISVACNSFDEDTIQAVQVMFDKFLGGHGSRATGSKKGCTEIRKANTGFSEPMLAMGIIEHRNSGGLKRKVHVPDFIMKSQIDVVAAFLRGLFEADGFAARDGTNIRFFSKHRHVVQDVQLLLLAFGIECRTSSQNKKSGSGVEYIGYELALRADGVRKYAVNIGFISKRKQDRANLSLNKRKTGSSANFNWSDTIVSITPAGESDVYDITTATHEFDAGGIVVHNCPEEAFQQSTDGCWYAEQMAKVRKGGRIVQGLPVLPAPVNTFWDIGRGDMTAIWFHQAATQQHRFLRYYEFSGEDLIHYVQQLQRYAAEHGYVYGTHYLPHEAGYRRIGETPDTSRTLQEMLEHLYPGQRFEVVPRVTNVATGIQATRTALNAAYFDADGCVDGIKRLENYKKRWNTVIGCWSNEPLHDDNSHGADAFRQWGQEVDAGNAFGGAIGKPLDRAASNSRRSWRTA